jgi:cbb3-type cytochrome oxidase subunit 1
MGLRFLKIAVVYLIAGVLLGLEMGMRQNFALAPVHAHVNLLGWATLALVGTIYHLYPEAAQTRLARIHFWLHNLALPVFMVSLARLLTGDESMNPVIGISATAVVVSLIVFAANVFINVKPRA